LTVALSVGLYELIEKPARTLLNRYLERVQSGADPKLLQRLQIRQRIGVLDRPTVVRGASTLSSMDSENVDNLK
jgi:peptidoglycan/LPS O-acetylase OafA/YrhL